MIQQKKTRKSRLITKKIECLPIEFLAAQFNEIRNKEFKGNPGVYAFYDKKGNLHYLGCSQDINQRVSYQKLYNKYSKKWKHFSVYFIKNKQTAIEVEAIILSIVKAESLPGNTQTPEVITRDMIKRDTKMEDRILKKMKKLEERKQKEIDSIKKVRRGIKSKTSTSKKTINKRKNNLNPSTGKKSSTLKNPYGKIKLLRAKYKKEPYQAQWLADSSIRFKDKIYNSPNKAALQIVDSKTINGRRFWKVQTPNGEWVDLNKCA